MSEVMKRKEFIDGYAEKFGITKKQAREEIDRYAEFAYDVIVDGQSGFRVGDVGTFKVKVVAEREYAVPNKPGEKSIVPTHYKLTFQPNEVTKNALREYEF